MMCDSLHIEASMGMGSLKAPWTKRAARLRPRRALCYQCAQAGPPKMAVS
jgi:hypothetical protein